MKKVFNLFLTLISKCELDWPVRLRHLNDTHPQNLQIFPRPVSNSPMKEYSSSVSMVISTSSQCFLVI